VDLPRIRQELLAEFGGRSDTHFLPIVVPRTFAGWGLPGPVTADLFTAAAEYYRQAPWRCVANSQVLHVEIAPGRSLACVVLGEGGIEHGLTVYDDARDIAVLNEFRTMAAFDHLIGGTVALTFDAPEDLPAAYVREVRRSRWALAQLPHFLEWFGPSGGRPGHENGVFPRFWRRSRAKWSI
jgi:hypothetical protein